MASYSFSVTYAIIAGAVLLCASLVWVLVVYNRLVRGRIRARNGFSQIDVQLKRRCDLIPNLVEAVRGYMTHERQTLESVITARNAMLSGLQAVGSGSLNASSIQTIFGASNVLDQLLMQLRVSIENYPDLKASTNVLGLQEELVSTENRIAYSRQAYNDAVLQFNTDRSLFPASLVASLFKFSELSLFSANESDRVLPEVKF